MCKEIEFSHVPSDYFVIAKPPCGFQTQLPQDPPRIEGYRPTIIFVDEAEDILVDILTKE